MSLHRSGVLLIAATMLVAGGCGGSNGDESVELPSLAAIHSATDLHEFLVDYSGPYTITNDPVATSENSSTVEFDGSSWRRTTGALSPTEVRVVVEDHTATCFQRVGDDWVDDVSTATDDGWTLADSMRVGIPSGSWDPTSLASATEWPDAGAGELAFEVQAPVDGALDRIVVTEGSDGTWEFELADGPNAVLRQTLSFAAVPEVQRPDDSSEGIDVECPLNG